MSLLFSVLLLYNRRGDSYNKVKRKSTGAELMTIKEIAKLAQVSSAAVSRYMNGGYVSEEKKERIRAVIEETGYRPSVQARTLRTKRACLVGVIVPKINSESISPFRCAQGKTEKVQSADRRDRTADKRGQLYLP